MIPDDDNTHEHVHSLNKFHEQQYQIFQQTGIHDVVDAVEQVHEIIVIEIHEHESHDAHDLQLVVELVEMHVIVDHEQHVDVQQIDSMVELDDKVEKEHILVDDDEVDDEVDEDSVMVEIDEETVDMNIDMNHDNDEVVEMLDIGEDDEMEHQIDDHEAMVDAVETDIVDEMVEMLFTHEMVDVEYCKVEMVEM